MTNPIEFSSLEKCIAGRSACSSLQRFLIGYATGTELGDGMLATLRNLQKHKKMCVVRHSKITQSTKSFQISFAYAEMHPGFCREGMCALVVFYTMSFGQSSFDYIAVPPLWVTLGHLQVRLFVVLFKTLRNV